MIGHGRRQRTMLPPVIALVIGAAVVTASGACASMPSWLPSPFPGPDGEADAGVAQCRFDMRAMSKITRLTVRATRRIVDPTQPRRSVRILARRTAALEVLQETLAGLQVHPELARFHALMRAWLHHLHASSERFLDSYLDPRGRGYIQGLRENGTANELNEELNGLRMSWNPAVCAEPAVT